MGPPLLNHCKNTKISTFFPNFPHFSVTVFQQSPSLNHSLQKNKMLYIRLFSNHKNLTINNIQNHKVSLKKINILRH